MSTKSSGKLFHLISIIFTFILAGITIIGAFACRVSPVDSSFMVFLALVLPFLILTNVILLIYWAIRFRYWVWIPLVAIICNWGYLSSMYQNPFRERSLPTVAETLKVATYNVGRFGKDSSGFSARRIAFYMYEQNVDVLCFQEFQEFKELPLDSISQIFSSWEYSAVPKPEDGTAILPIAIYSRYPIIKTQLITYPDTPNCSMWCDILVNGKTVRVFNNHLQTTSVSQSRRTYDKMQNAGVDYGTQFVMSAGNEYYANDIIRANQADNMSKLIKESPYPVMVCGDFNSPPSSYVYRTMKGDLKDGFKTSGHGYGYTYRYFKRILRIDYIFYSPSMRGIDYYSPDLEYGSDHNPVLMEVEI